MITSFFIIDKGKYSKLIWGGSFCITFVKIGTKVVFHMENQMKGGARAKNEEKLVKMRLISRWRPKYWKILKMILEYQFSHSSYKTIAYNVFLI